MNDSEIQRLAQQMAIANRQLIIEEIDRRMRLPTGVDSGGPYHGFSVNDQGNVIQASQFASRRFSKSGASTTINNTTQTEYAWNTEETFSYDTPTDATWFDGSTPKRIIVPFSGVLMTTIQAYWVTDNTTGTRVLNIDQDSASRGGGGWDSITFAWPSKKDTGYLSEYPALVWVWDVVAGDEFRIYNEHNGGVNTLKCFLTAAFVQIG